LSRSERSVEDATGRERSRAERVEGKPVE
jgi:hypothetical protein